MSREEKTASPIADTSVYENYLYACKLTPEQIQRLSVINERSATQDEMIQQCALLNLKNTPGSFDAKISELENLPFEKLSVLVKYKPSGLISGKILRELTFELNEHHVTVFSKLFSIAKSLPITDLILFVERTACDEWKHFLTYDKKQSAFLILLLKMFQISCNEAMDLQNDLTEKDIDAQRMVLSCSFFNNPINKPTVLVLIQKIIRDHAYYAENVTDSDYLSLIAKKCQDLHTLQKIIDNRNASLEVLKHIAKSSTITAKMLEDLLSSGSLDAELAHLVLIHPKAIVTNYVKDGDIIHRVCQTYEIDVLQKFVDHFPATPEAIDNFLKLACTRNEFLIMRDNIQKFKNAKKMIDSYYFETLANNPYTPSELLHDIVLASEEISEPLFNKILCHKKISHDTFRLIAALAIKTYLGTESLCSLKIAIIIEIQKYINIRSAEDFKKSPATELKLQDAKELLYEISHISMLYEVNDVPTLKTMDMLANEISGLLDIAIFTNKKNVRFSIWYTQGDYLKTLTRCKAICAVRIEASKNAADLTDAIEVGRDSDHAVVACTPTAIALA